MNGLKLYIEQQAGKITFNYEESKALLEQMMSEYKGAVFTDESMDIAKRERAALRKLKEEADSKRKAVKRVWMAPYEDFEAKVKELLLLIEEPIQLIDGQVKKYEKEKKAEKEALCRRIYAEEIGELEGVLTWDKVFSAKWLNAGTSVKTVREEIRNSVQTVMTQMDTIKMMNSDAAQEALAIYRNTLDFTRALAHINNYEETKRAIAAQEEKQKAAEEEKRREAERERIRREERERIRAEEAFRQDARREAAESLKEVSPKVKEASAILPRSVTALYAVTATEEELRNLEITLTSLGICFERKG